MRRSIRNFTTAALCGLSILLMVSLAAAQSVTNDKSNDESSDSAAVMQGQYGRGGQMSWAQSGDRPGNGMGRGDRNGPGHRGGPGGPGDRWHKKQRKAIEQFRMLRMLEALDLSSDQEVQFLTMFNRMRQADDSLQDRKSELLESLMQAVDEGTDDKKIASLNDAMLNLEKERRASFFGFVEQTRKILTPLQVGRLIVFHERFEVEMLERLRNFWDRRNMGPGGMMQPPDDMPDMPDQP